MFSLTAKLYAGAALAIVLLLTAAGLLHAHDNQVRAAQNAAQQAEALKATQEAREEEQRRIAAQELVNAESQRLAARARADTAALSAAAPGLQRALAVACFRAGPSYPAAADVSASAADATGVRADVPGEIVERLRALARIADERGIAGNACVGSYDSLTKPSITLGRLRLGG